MRQFLRLIFFTIYASGQSFAGWSYSAETNSQAAMARIMFNMQLGSGGIFGTPGYNYPSVSDRIPDVTIAVPPDPDALAKAIADLQAAGDPGVATINNGDTAGVTPYWGINTDISTENVCRVISLPGSMIGVASLMGSTNTIAFDMVQIGGKVLESIFSNGVDLVTSNITDSYKQFSNSLYIVYSGSNNFGALVTNQLMGIGLDSGSTTNGTNSTAYGWEQPGTLWGSVNFCDAASKISQAMAPMETTRDRIKRLVHLWLTRATYVAFFAAAVALIVYRMRGILDASLTDEVAPGSEALGISVPALGTVIFVNMKLFIAVHVLVSIIAGVGTFLVLDTASAAAVSLAKLSTDSGSDGQNAIQLIHQNSAGGQALMGNLTRGHGYSILAMAFTLLDFVPLGTILSGFAAMGVIWVETGIAKRAFLSLGRAIATLAS